MRDATVSVDVQRWREGAVEETCDEVAEEAPIALSYHGVPHVVMLATPSDLEDLGVGFSLSEAIVTAPAEIQSVESAAREDGALEVRIGIAAQRFSEVLRRQRNLHGRTGCGLCGTENVEDAIRTPVAVRGACRVSAAELHVVLDELKQHQHINSVTGSVHAAAWVVPGQGIRFAREDVGRHNALDKVIGAVVRAGRDCSEGYFVVTSRASYEMVLKAATLGAGLLAAVSAPTGFAIGLARTTGLTLVGFARERSHVVYTHPWRLT